MVLAEDAAAFLQHFLFERQFLVAPTQLAEGGGQITHRRQRIGMVLAEDAAAFFGITLHADKEILMMVVEKEIRDQVLNALYKEMGLGKKSQGIALSLPVSDVAGLAVPVEAQETAED